MEYPPEIVAQMVALRDTGMTARSISRQLGMHHSTVTRRLATYNASCSFAACPRSGRPPVTTPRTDNMIRRQAVINPTASSAFIANQLPENCPAVSSRTIRRRLNSKFNLKSFMATKKPRLSAKNIRDRLVFANQYRRWTPQDWHQASGTIRGIHSQRIYILHPS